MTDALTLFDGTPAARNPEVVQLLTDVRPGIAARSIELEHDATARPHDRERREKADRYRACLDDIDRVLAEHSACDEFVPDVGGAHPWCATCGWQQPHHETGDT